MQERQYTFKVYHLKQYLFPIVAHTKWEAVEKAMFQTGWKFNRKNIRAIIW